MTCEDYALMASRASRRAARCAQLLCERLDDTASVSARTLFHDNGNFHSEAFHTVHRKPVDPDTSGPFMREAVKYSTNPNQPEHYEHVVQHFFDGVHDRWYEYTLETIEDREVTG